MRYLALLGLLGLGALPQDPDLAFRMDEEITKIPQFNRNRASGRSDDGEFLRRVMLDLVGRPPNGVELRAFAADPAPGKRLARVDQLLATPRFADFWSRRFAEVFFGNYAEAPIELNDPLRPETQQAIFRAFIVWLRDGIFADRSMRDIVFDMINARGWAGVTPELAYKLSFYRGEGQALEFADGASRHLLGISLYCARCHDHPHDRWTIEDYYGLADCVYRQKARRVALANGGEDVFVDYAEEGDIALPNPAGGWRGGPRMAPVFMGNALPPNADRAGTLAAMMARIQGTLLARGLTNRIWSWLLGSGVAEPVDNMSFLHRPVSEPLLKLLVKTFDEGKGSLRFLIRTICSTEAYQRSSSAWGPCTRRDFCQGRVLPLSGEQLHYSIQVATRGLPRFDVLAAQKFTLALDVSRPRVCETRPQSCSAPAALKMRNDPETWDAIRNGGVLKGISALPEDSRVEKMFEAALSRKPDEAERIRYGAFLKERGVEGLEDAYWSLLNSTEFLTRH